MLQKFKQILLGQTFKLSLKWKVLLSVVAFLNLLMISFFFVGWRPLTGLFYYSFFSNSPLGWTVPIMPQEPMLLLYGTFYAPWLVALVAGSATFMVELLNYQVLVPVCNLEQLQPFKKKCFYQILERYFNKVPFAVITFVAFTPVPHLPFRFLAVLTGYSVVRYALASFSGRTLFYYLVALTGATLSLPYWVYIILFLAMVALALTTKVAHSCRRRARVKSN